MITVDVNTGRNRGSKDVDKMLMETNVEAAEEVARQLRLRNIGGLVVVDFIDMRHRRDQQAVYRAMKERLKRDKAKTQVLQISSIGLMEMTRQRLNESLRDSLLEPCPYCEGRGRVKTPMTMSVEVQRALNTVIQRGEGATSVTSSLSSIPRCSTALKMKTPTSLSNSSALTAGASPSAQTLHSIASAIAIIEADTEKNAASSIAGKRTTCQRAKRLRSTKSSPRKNPRVTPSGINKIGPLLTGGFAKKTANGSNPLRQAGGPLCRFPSSHCLGKRALRSSSPNGLCSCAAKAGVNSSSYRSSSWECFLSSPSA